MALCGTRVEGIAPGYTRSAGVRFDATSAEAADALAGRRLYTTISWIPIDSTRSLALSNLDLRILISVCPYTCSCLTVAR